MSDKKKKKGSIRKIIFTGLDNSGKSDFVARLKTQNNPMNVTPEGEQYEVFGFPILIWKASDQKKLLLEKTHFFDETDILFYLIDIQDETRFDEAVDNLKAILKILTIKPLIMICFHKADTDIAQSQKVRKETENIKEQLKDALKPFEHSYTLTTIFDYTSVLGPFVFALSKLLPFSVVLDSYIIDYFDVQQLACILVLDKSGAIISKTTGVDKEGKLDLDFCQVTGMHLSELYELYDKSAMPIPNLSIKIPENSKRNPNAMVLFERIIIRNKHYYLVMLIKTPEQFESIKDTLPEFVSGLSKTIELSL